MKASAQNLTGAARKSAGAPVEGQTTVQAESLKMLKAQVLLKCRAKIRQKGRLKPEPKFPIKTPRPEFQGQIVHRKDRDKQQEMPETR